MRIFLLQPLLVLFILTASISGLSAANIRIDSPKSGYSSRIVYEISGRIDGYDKPQATLVINGLPQTFTLKNGNFMLKAVASPGLNHIEIHADGAKEKVSLYATVPSRDIKVLLTWDTPSYVDLWVTDPKGKRCYWAEPISSNGGNLVYNDATFAPQVFTMVKAIPGTYSIQIQNYGAFGHPVSRVKVYLVLYEGTPREERKEWQFVATREHTVYHITDFQIEKD